MVLRNTGLVLIGETAVLSNVKEPAEKLVMLSSGSPI